jgi:hypothetical protein
MAAIPGSVPVMGVLAPPDSLDRFAITDSQYGIDGLRSVGTLVDRNNISAQRRRHGMVVFVQSENTYYSLDADLIGWSIFEGGSGGSTPPITINIYSETVMVSKVISDDVTLPDFVTMTDGDIVTAGVY